MMCGKLFWEIGDSEKHVKVEPVQSSMRQYRTTEKNV